MKRRTLFFMWSCAMVLGVFAPNNTLRAQEGIQALIASKNYGFDANRASPLGLPSRSIVNLDNFIKVHNDSTQGYLPYFGEMRLGGGYGEGGPIQFDSGIKAYKVRQKKNNKGVIVSFSAKNGNEQFDLTMDITKSGSAMVTIKSLHRNSITYNGVIRKLEKEKP